MAVSSSSSIKQQHGGGLLKLFKFEKTIGKATRWIRGVIGTKKHKRNTNNKSDQREKTPSKRRGDHIPLRAHFGPSSVSEQQVDQIKHAITVATTTLAAADAAAEAAEAAIDTAARLSSSIDGRPEVEQSQQAIDLATASVAAVESIVAVAEVTVVVARLTSFSRRGGGILSGDDDERVKSAAVMIQRVYRGHLARRALSALKGLVKLQALVRGNLVRNRVAADSAQSIRSEKEMRSRKLFEYLEKSSSTSHESLEIMEIDSCGFKFGVNEPVTPVAKSACGSCFFRQHCNKRPNYMANTESFRAKLTPCYALKQKLEPRLRRKNLSNNKIMDVRS